MSSGSKPVSFTETIHRLFVFMAVTCLLQVGAAQTASANELDSLRHLLTSAQGAERAQIMSKLAGVIATSDLAEADSLVMESLAIAEKNGLKEEKVSALLIKVRLLLHGYRYSEAEQLLQETAELAQKTEDRTLISRVHLSLGNLYFHRDRLAESFDEFQKTLTLANETSDPDMQTTGLMNLGRVKEITGDLAEAETYYQKAITICGSAGLPVRMAQLYVNMAVLEYKRNNIGLSLEYNQKALELAQENADRGLAAVALSNIGFANAVLGNKDKAMEIYREALAIRKEIGDRRGVGTVDLYMAKILQDKNPKDAEKLGLEVVGIAEEIMDNPLKRDALSFLYDFAKSNGDLSAALEYYQQLTTVKDSLEAKANRIKILELEGEYRFKELQRQNQLQEAQVQAANLKIGQRNILLVGLTLIALLLAVLFLLTRKQLSDKLRNSMGREQEARTEAEALGRELANERQRLLEYTDKLLQRNLDREQSASTESVDPEVEPKNVEALARMLDRLNVGDVNDQDWITFSMLFEAAYPGFSSALNRAFGTLTQSEVRLASLIKLKLSNKEIGAILNISRDSVVRAKYRLRQKFGADTNKELEKAVLRL